jgi:hypothetical protein
MASDSLRPVSFFLNESHELLRAEKDGGGGNRKLAPIDWVVKGNRIEKSLSRTVDELVKYDDPGVANHLYLLAKPQPTVRTLHESKKRGTTSEEDVPTSFSGADSRVFTRLGAEMLRVDESGSAIVHLRPSHAQQLKSTAAKLHDLGPREQARWITVDAFDLIPPELRLDEVWFQRLGDQKVVDSVIELQPLLNRVEVDSVVRALFASIQVNAPEGQRISGSGSDFSGRNWLRARLSKKALRVLAERFPSIQSLHSPLLSQVAGLAFPPLPIAPLPSQPSANAPRVGVVDTGIPANHLVLAPFRQGEFKTQYSQGGYGTHGSQVASRVVFGEGIKTAGANTSPAIGFLDINVAFTETQIDDKQVIGALQAIVSTSPDVRVFNLSFDNEPLSRLSPIMRAERLLLTQDLDNFIYQNDVLLVISAGNTPPGIIPAEGYPENWNNEGWKLGAYACSFNSLTCGSYVSELTASPSVVQDIGWPSPFCRVGPGIARSFKPDFSAPGGNASPNYSCGQGLGVPVLNNAGQWIENCGTSFAAPLLSREAAIAFRLLESISAVGSRPFSATVKAFLALTSKAPVTVSATKELASRTLGYGTASAEKLSDPSASSAVFLWQGVLEDKNDIARIQIPIPREWLEQASKAKLRLVVAADVPVNAAASELWATRKINVTLHRDSESRGLTAQKRRGGETYPLVSQEYNLARVKLEEIESDFWIVKLSYEVIADYLPTMSFAAQQRVAFAAELLDDSPMPLSPQPTLLQMPVAASMTRLSIQTEPIQTPVVLRYL